MKLCYFDFKKRIIMLRFRGKYPSTKAMVGLYDIFIVYSRHVEAVTLLVKE